MQSLCNNIKKKSETVRQESVWMSQLFCGLGLNSQATQVNLGKRSHEESSVNTGALVQHRLPIAAWLQQLSHRGWAFPGQDQHPLCAHRANPPPGVSPAFSPWLPPFPEFAELCGKGWEALRCPHCSLTPPRVPGLSSPGQGVLISDCCF